MSTALVKAYRMKEEESSVQDNAFHPSTRILYRSCLSFLNNGNKCVDQFRLHYQTLLSNSHTKLTT